MKKLITYSTICLITILVFSSCKSKWGITKRHYNNGYYIAHSKDRKAGLEPKEKKIGLVQSKKKTTPVMNEVVQPTIMNSEAIVSTIEEPKPKEYAQVATKGIVKKNTITIENPVLQVKHAILEIKKAKSTSSDGDRDGLSLFWIIILVVLILWALGYISGGFGLGAFINVLLVVALILLILWLLRIV